MYGWTHFSSHSSRDECHWNACQAGWMVVMRLVGFLGQVRRLRICNGKGRGPSSPGSLDFSGGLGDRGSSTRRG